MRDTYTFRAHKPKRRSSKAPKVIIAIVLLLVAGLVGYRILGPSAAERAVSRLEFDQSVTEVEKRRIEDAVRAQEKTISTNVSVKVETSTNASANPAHILSAYVPVTHEYAVRQSVSTAELALLPIGVPQDTDETVRSALAQAIGTDTSNITSLASPDLSEIPEDTVALIPASQLNANVKLLQLDDSYYLDTFNAGAFFRQATFGNVPDDTLATLNLNELAQKDEVLSVNTTGVTALTRMMMRRLNTVGDPTYFSAEIGDFLASADITHVSNEVSFMDNCQWNAALFCSPPEFIETLKASGVDAVELTGNHNNDLGSTHNTRSIELYHSLGWKTFGGGLNDEEAAKPAIFDQKGTKVAFLGYNYPDSPNGGAISGPTSAGANKWDIDKIKSDIETAKQQVDFVFVHIQFWECYAYPEGYLEFPECDAPIPNQAPVFKQVADLGADMVVGSSAHQPQTYEVYNGVPIYYGLGNLYFDQDRWPGTERGIILTHYFNKGKLIQTRLTPTVYDSDYQTRKMTAEEAEYLLGRLSRAR